MSSPVAYSAHASGANMLDMPAIKAGTVSRLRRHIHLFALVEALLHICLWVEGSALGGRQILAICFSPS